MSRAEYQREWKKNNPEKVKQYRDKFASLNRQYMSDRQRKYQLQNKYGITEEIYNSLLEAQNHKCAICFRTEPTGRWKRLAVDHCHITRQVRGLLCDKCNRGMGLLEDNIELLESAAKYLKQHKKKTKKERQ